MGKHMLTYHVALPIAVFAVMVLVAHSNDTATPRR